MNERINRIRKDITELDEYVKKNKEDIKKLKEQYEKAVKISERFIDRIKAMEEEVRDLENGMYAIDRHHVRGIIIPRYDDEE